MSDAVRADAVGSFSLIHPRNSSGRPLYHPVALQKKSKMFLRFGIPIGSPEVFHDHREEVEEEVFIPAAPRWLL